MQRRLPSGQLVAAVLLVAYWLMAVTAAADKSSTFDEPDHITSGYSQWIHNDYRLEPASRTLANRWAALPLLALGLRFPPLTDPEWDANRRDLLTERFFYDEGNDARRILRYSRGAMALLGVALGWMTYCWSRRLFGEVGGLLSLALFCFSPTMLAHGALASSDIASGLFFLVFAFCFWNLLERVTPLRVLASAFAAGALIMIKASGLLVLPLAAVLLVVRLVVGRPLRVCAGSIDRTIDERPRQLAIFSAIGIVHVLIVVALVWAAFGFRYSAFNEDLPGQRRFLMPWEQTLDTYGPARPAVEFVRRHQLLPEGWLYGLSLDLKSAEGRPAFLNGEYSVTGWRSFFPYAAAVKTPLPLFAILLLALVVTIRSVVGSDDRRGAVFDGLYAAAPLWVLLLVVWGFAINSSLNIGHRHILATYPPLFILAGAAVTGRDRLGRSFTWIAGIATVTFLIVSLSIRPHYLSYFNFLAGGPSQGYRHLVDSSLDWGQDLPALARWLEGHVADNATVYLSYFGSARPEYYGIRAARLPGKSPNSFFGGPLGNRPAARVDDLQGGVYCISATMLQRLYTNPAGPWTAGHESLYRSLHSRRYSLRGVAEIRRYVDLRFVRLCTALLEREPDANAGHSILIYRLSDEQIRLALDVE